MNKIYFCITAVFLFTVVFSGCLDEINGNDQLKKRLTELEAEVDDQEDALKDRIAGAEHRIVSEMQSQMRLDTIRQQLAEANDRQRLETIRDQLQAMESGGPVPKIIWQLCLSAIMVVFTAIIIKALLAYFKGGNGPVIHLSITSDKVIKISQNSEPIKLLENSSGNTK